MAAESGSNLLWAKVQPFISRFPVGAPKDSSQPAAAILLVEDNSGDVGLVREALEHYKVNCELFVASDGEKAIRIIEAIEQTAVAWPSLVILDLNLPKKTGREVLVRIRKSPQCDKLPVIIFSSSDDPRDKQDAERLGAHDYVVKSSDLEQLMEIGAAVKSAL